MDWHTRREAALNIFDQLHAVQVEYCYFWKGSIVFTWRWWIALALLVLPWVLWGFVRKRGSEGRLLCAGGIISALSIFMDQVGVTMHLWTYPTTLTPMMPSFLPFDLASLPVATMLTLQFFPKVKLRWKALAYAAGGTVFDFLCDTAGLSDQEGWGWSRAYTFIILFLLFLLAYWLANRLRFEPIAGRPE